MKRTQRKVSRHTVALTVPANSPLPPHWYRIWRNISLLVHSCPAPSPAATIPLGWRNSPDTSGPSTLASICFNALCAPPSYLPTMLWCITRSSTPTSTRFNANPASGFTSRRGLAVTTVRSKRNEGFYFKRQVN